MNFNGSSNFIVLYLLSLSNLQYSSPAVIGISAALHAMYSTPVSGFTKLSRSLEPLVSTTVGSLAHEQSIEAMRISDMITLFFFIGNS